MVSPLDDFDEESGSVGHHFSENLEDVSVVVEVNQNLKFAQHLEVLVHFGLGVRQLGLDEVVLAVGDVQEFESTLLEVGDFVDDVPRAQCDVLHARAALLVDLLLDLGHALAFRRFIDRHFDSFVEVADHGALQRRKFSLDLIVVHTPETVPVQVLQEPLHGGNHVACRLILHDMVDE